jgi:hypothetical protein
MKMLRIKVNGKRYGIVLRGSFEHIKSGKEFEKVLRQSFVKRYGSGQDEGRSIFEMDACIGMISQSYRLGD